MFRKLATLILINFAISFPTNAGSNKNNEQTKFKNVIFMVSDGFGPASETFARNYHNYVNGYPKTQELPLDTILIGSSRTNSDDSFITDSASGATAFSCGFKTYNAAIAVKSDLSPCGTVLESAKLNGYLTGLVATSRITHATPAAWSAHVSERDDENRIAQHQIGNYTLGRVTDLMIGGGSRHFQHKSVKGSKRTDDRDLLAEAAAIGWDVGTDKASFDALTSDSKLPLMRLITQSHLSYMIDRDPTKEPTLKEMSDKALNILKSSTEKEDAKGFFLMIEGSRIDHAAHSNDARTHFEEILAYQETIELAKKFVDENPGTILISVSDHETGGLSVALQEGIEFPIFEWLPEALTKQKASTAVVSSVFEKKNKELSGDAKYAYFKKEIKSIFNINPTDEEIAFISAAPDAQTIDNFLGTAVSKRAKLGWSTHGHSAVDVNLYAYGAGTNALVGSNENVELGTFVETYLNLDLEAVTKILVENVASLEIQPLITKRSVSHHHQEL